MTNKKYKKNSNSESITQGSEMIDVSTPHVLLNTPQKTNIQNINLENTGGSNSKEDLKKPITLKKEESMAIENLVKFFNYTKLMNSKNCNANDSCIYKNKDEIMISDKLEIKKENSKTIDINVCGYTLNVANNEKSEMINKSLDCDKTRIEKKKEGNKKRKMSLYEYIEKYDIYGNQINLNKDKVNVVTLSFPSDDYILNYLKCQDCSHGLDVSKVKSLFINCYKQNMNNFYNSMFCKPDMNDRYKFPTYTPMKNESVKRTEITINGESVKFKNDKVIHKSENISKEDNSEIKKSESNAKDGTIEDKKLKEEGNEDNILKCDIQKNQPFKSTSLLESKEDTSLFDYIYPKLYVSPYNKPSENKPISIPNRRPREYICEVCNAKLTSKNGLDYHLNNVHSDAKGKVVKPYECPIVDCNKKYKNKNGLHYHLRHYHDEEDMRETSSTKETVTE